MIFISGGDLSMVNGKIVGGNGTEGNGIAESVFRDVGEFTGIRVEGGVDVTYSQGESTQLELTADSNLLELITTEVINGLLVVGSSGSFSTQSNMTINCQSEHVKSVCITGSGDVDLQTITAGTLRVEIKGSGDVYVDGEGLRLNTTIRGSGDVDASGLEVESAKISIQGSGNVKARVAGALDVVIRGSGSARISGNPSSVKEKVTGSGKLKIK